MRGRRPTPPHLHLVGATHPVGAAATAPVKTHKVPAGLRGKARVAWETWFANAPWLDPLREPSAVAFCLLWRQFLQDPGSFDSARLAQMRHFMTDAGLTDLRNRVDPTKRKQGDLFGT